MNRKHEFSNVSRYKFTSVPVGEGNGDGNSVDDGEDVFKLSSIFDKH